MKQNRERLMTPAIEAEDVNILFDPEFQNSVAQVKEFSCLDIARLANLWNLARLAGPGIFLEVGTYKGGTALHICNAIKDRGAAFYCFDPFEKGGFEKIGDRTNVSSPATLRTRDMKPSQNCSPRNPTPERFKDSSPRPLRV